MELQADSVTMTRGCDRTETRTSRVT